MSNGSPDYTRKVKIYAWDGTNLVPVKVDSDGNIIMVPYGTLTVDGAVDVSQTDSIREIQGADGVTLRTIAVDSSGNIISVIKGDYLGSLKNIKVDEDGRMIALITDELDIYNNKVIVGNAELAVRLGSEKFFDRRGDVIFIDNFENGTAKWRLSGVGTGNKQVLTADKSRSRGYSVKLVGGSTATFLAEMYARIPYPVLSKWGFEVHFAMGSNIDKVQFSMVKFTGTQAKSGLIRYDRTNEKLQYVDKNGADQDIETSFKLSQSDYLFHVFKLVQDLENDKFHRLIINETTYDLSAYDVYTYSDTSTKHISIGIELYSRSGNNDYIYIDNVIVTQNEPD